MTEEVFVSFSSADIETVRRLVQELDQYPELHIWFSEREVLPGPASPGQVKSTSEEEVWTAIRRGIDSSSVFLLCESTKTRSIGAGQLFSMERRYAESRMARDPSFRIVPVLLEAGNGFGSERLTFSEGLPASVQPLVRAITGPPPDADQGNVAPLQS